jgi:prepilin-type N-terminal cleavage/methylation domain-containing protein
VNRRGFTLVEMLVALALLGLFLLLVNGIYSGTTRNREASRAATTSAHEASVALHLMGDEFAMAFLSPAWIGRSAFNLETDADDFSKVDFTTRVPNIDTLRVGGDVRLRYELVPEEERKDRFILRRTEGADFFADLDRQGVAYDMMSGIKRFTVKCWDGEAWTDRWEVDPANPQLPLAVAVRIVWSRGGGEAEEVLVTTTPVYAAAGRNNLTQGGGGSPGGGTAPPGSGPQWTSSGLGGGLLPWPW